MNRTLKIAGAAAVLILTIALSTLRAGEAEDHKGKIETWLSKARAAGTLDCDMLKKMWELTCGADLEANEPDELNKVKAEISGLTGRLVNDLKKLGDDYAPLEKKAEELKKAKKSSAELDKAVVKMKKTMTNLITLRDTGAAKGVLHPSVQLAAMYGKGKHDDYNGKFSCTIYDRQLTSGRTRPDCVIVGPDACYLYEFKPENSAAVSKGNSQLSDYRSNIPVDKAGGYLAQYQRDTVAKYCSSSGKMKFKVVAVKTYQMCRQEYRCKDPTQ